MKNNNCVRCWKIANIYHNWDSICNICKTKIDKESLYAFYFLWIPAFIFIIYIIIKLIIYAI